MHAAILAVGDELVLGEKTDTNSAWLSGRLAELSIITREHRTVADDRSAIADAIRILAGSSDLLLISGGLGPTPDDLTRDALGDVLDPDRPLVLDVDAERTLRAWFGRRSRVMPESNLAQAHRPASMRIVPNAKGTAPGLAGRLGRCDIYAMPGPPRELMPMFETEIVPKLPAATDDVRLGVTMVHCFGLGEAPAAERLGAMMTRDANPSVGTTASSGVVTARIRGQAAADDLAAVLERTAAAVERAWAPFAFGRDATTIAAAVASLLQGRAETLVTAESCTGGWLGKLIVDEPNASRHYRGGWVTYDNDLKRECLGVAPALLEQHGAVSAPVVEAMAQGGLREGGSDWCVSISGVAGPDAEPGPDGAVKPAGRVFIGLAGRNRAAAASRVFQFPGERGFVRRLSALAALQMLRLELLGAPETPLLWERPHDAGDTV